MGQCVMKDCGFNTDKLSSPQKKNLKLFLTERIKDRYHPTETELKKADTNFLSEDEFLKSPLYEQDTKYSARVPTKSLNDKFKNLSVKQENNKQHFNFDLSDNTIASMSTKTNFFPSKDQINSKKNLSSINNADTLQNIPEIIKTSHQDITSLKQIIECLDKNPTFSQNFENEEEDLPYKGFENRMFTHENIDENFGNIFSEENNSFEESNNEFEENEDFEKKFPEHLIEKTSHKEKKLTSNLK